MKRRAITTVTAGLAILFLLAGTSLAENRVLTIYFCGTSATSEWNDSLKSGWHSPELVASLYASDNSDEVAKLIRYVLVLPVGVTGIVDSVGAQAGKAHYKFILDGFGTPNNLWEVIEPNNGPRTWAVAVGEAFLAINKVLELNPGDQFHLNLVGWSRGGILCMKTARSVANTPSVNSRITSINILAFDPVPGTLSDPVGAFGDDFKLPSKVSQFVGLYAYHEMSASFEPVIPYAESSSTRSWIVGVPGSHETMMGNFQVDGHHDVGSDSDYSHDPAMAHVVNVTTAIAQQLLGSNAWGQVPMPEPPAGLEQSFKSIVGEMWGYNTSAIKAKTFTLWPWVWNCHPDAMLRGPADIIRHYEWRLAFVAPNRHEPHWGWVGFCDILLPLRLFPADRVYWLDDRVPKMGTSAWDTLQSFRADIPEGMDTTPPVPTISPLPDLTAECKVTATAPTADDAFSGTVAGKTTDPTEYTQVGSYVIHWTYTDKAGNVATQTQNVTVTADSTPPAITGGSEPLPAQITESLGPGSTSCSLFVSDTKLGTAKATDTCSGEVQVTRTGVPDGNLFPVGTTTVTYTAVDAAGNSNAVVQKVTVIDNALPELEVPEDIVKATDPGLCSAVVTFTPKATDNCPNVVVVSNPPSGSVFLPGTTAVTVTATDASGNLTTKNFNVNVEDREGPKITNALPTPALLWPPNHQFVAVTINYGAADNCSPAVCALTVTSNEPVNGTDDGDTEPDWQIVDTHTVLLRAERAGTGTGRLYTITISCSDGIGNSSSQTLFVTVPLNRN